MGLVNLGWEWREETPTLAKLPGAKATLYDPGINTTLLMRFPSLLAGEHVVDELIGNVDLFPTVLQIAGVTVPDGIQGRSFLPLLRGASYRPRDIVFAEKNTTPHDVKRAVRTVRHKYIRNYTPGVRLMLATDLEISLTRRDMGNDHVAPRPEVELYDIEKDPLEKRNLAGLPEFADIEQELAGRLRAIQEETNDPILQGPTARPAGEAESIANAWAKARKECRYVRDGMLAGYDIMGDTSRKLEFAEPRARY